MRRLWLQNARMRDCGGCGAFFERVEGGGWGGVRVTASRGVHKERKDSIFFRRGVKQKVAFLICMMYDLRTHTCTLVTHTT
jgi:hypothetical protein